MKTPTTGERGGGELKIKTPFSSFGVDEPILIILDNGSLGSSPSVHLSGRSSRMTLQSRMGSEALERRSASSSSWRSVLTASLDSKSWRAKYKSGTEGSW